MSAPVEATTKNPDRPGLSSAISVEVDALATASIPSLCLEKLAMSVNRKKNHLRRTPDGLSISAVMRLRLPRPAGWRGVLRMSAGQGEVP